MRLTPALLLAVGVCAAVSGCRSNTHLVERELRARETDVRELREELDRCAAYNQALQLELRAMHGEVIGPGPVCPVRSLVLGRQTGGRELEGCTGDGALQVVLEPRDPEGQSIKVPAAALVQAVEIAPDGTKHLLSTWEVPPEQLTKLWRSGLLTTGYVLVLPWKEPPTTEKLRVVAALRLADGRTFEADKDVTIRPPSGVKRRIMPPPMPEPAPLDSPLLPLPRPVDPAAPPPTPPNSEARKPWWEVPPRKPVEPAAAIGRPQLLP